MSDQAWGYEGVWTPTRFVVYRVRARPDLGPRWMECQFPGNPEPLVQELPLHFVGSLGYPTLRELLRARREQAREESEDGDWNAADRVRTVEEYAAREGIDL